MFVSHEVFACLHLEDARIGLQVRLAQGLSAPAQRLPVVDWPLSGLWAPLPLRRSMRRPGYAREAGVGGLMVFERLLERKSGFTSVFGAYEGWTAEGFARWPGRAMSGFQAHEGPAEVAVP